jgi:ribosomal protein S18 acetylase RimI-like enzyme
MPGSTPEILPCPPADRTAALGVLYRRVHASLRPRLIVDAMAEADQGLIDLSGLWIARRRARIVGALLTQPLAGRAAAVWAPEVEVTWGRAATAITLVRAALDDLRARGFRIAQALLDESAPRQASADLVGGGMLHVTDLIYLERPTADPLKIRPGTPALSWRSYAPEDEAGFRAVLQATYIDSLDMPELEGIRSLDDIMASHRTGGRFDPSRWRVGAVPGEPGAGAVLLLSALPDHDAWEVAYLGLTPAARGRGLGRAALAHALDLARPHAPRIELAVDLRNEPATRLYRDAGFSPFDRRAVHLASFPETAP